MRIREVYYQLQTFPENGWLAPGSSLAAPVPGSPGSDGRPYRDSLLHQRDLTKTGNTITLIANVQLQFPALITSRTFAPELKDPELRNPAFESNRNNLLARCCR